MQQKSNIIRFIIALILCEGAGIVGSLFTVSAIKDWYVNLNKLFFSPPNWLFGPAWTLFYFLMALALYWIWQKGLSNKSVLFAFWIFIVQLAVNAIWSVLFFGLRSPILGLVDIVVMWLLIVYNIYLFYKIDKKAGLILIPYWLWVTFAAMLNFAVWQLNLE